MPTISTIVYLKKDRILDLQNRFDVREITDEMQQKVKSIIK